MMVGGKLEAITDELPEGWIAANLGMTSWVRARLGWKGLKADEYVEKGVAFLSTPDIKTKEIDYQVVNRITNERYRESPEIALEIGDVLLTKDGSTIGIVHVIRALPEPTTVNGSIAVITPSTRWESRFLGYVLESQWAQALMRRLQDGMGVPHLFQRDIKRLKLPLPPLETQQRIADYLDRETAEVDAAVADIDKYVELLEKRRSTFITLAVECEVGPGRLCRDLLQVKLGYVVSHIRTGLNPRKNFELDTTDAENWYVTVRELAGYNIQVSGKTSKINDKALELIQRRSNVRVGDVLFSGTGTIGNTAIVSDPPSNWGVKEGIYVLTPDTNLISSRFLLWLLKSDKIALFADQMSDGSTIKSISIDKLKRVRFSLPPLGVQREIVNYLDRETSEIDSLIADSTKLRELLLKRRSVLITDVVTGRKQV